MSVRLDMACQDSATSFVSSSALPCALRWQPAPFSPFPRICQPSRLEQAALYRLEVALAVFYGCLLLATPAYSGLVRGRLPTEISTRGAKFADEADQTVEQDEAAIKELRASLSLGSKLAAHARADIDLLRRGSVTTT